MVLAWTKFAICAVLIGMAGPLLTRYGDIIARRTGLSRSWIGLLLLATATSLPELVVAISASRLGALDMAAANYWAAICSTFSSWPLTILPTPAARCLRQSSSRSRRRRVSFGAAGAPKS